MLTVDEEYFGTQDIAEIKNWLSLPGAGLFRRALMNEIARDQIQASEVAIKAIEPDMARFDKEAAGKLRRVRDLQQVIKELDRAASKDFKPFVAKVVTI